MTCADCRAGHEHCHEVLLVHADGETECAGDDCDGAHERHEHLADCDDPRCGCIS